MATPLDAKVPTKVKATLDKYGQAAALWVESDAVADVVAGTRSATGDWVPVKVSPPYPYRRSATPSADTGMAAVVMAALGNPVPARQGRLRLADARVVTIDEVDPIMSGDAVAAYALAGAF